MSATTLGHAATPEEAYLDRLLVARLLLPTSLPGIYTRGGTFTQILEGLERSLTGVSQALRAQLLRCPPVLPRSVVEKYGPQLAIAPSTDITLTPSACYAAFPYLTGKLPAGGRTLDVQSWCYRHEPSLNPLQLCAFQVREFVYAGAPEQAQQFRAAGAQRAQELLQSLGLSACIVPDTDTGVSKWALTVPVVSEERPTSLVSASYHAARFGQLLEISTPEGASAHTACLAFGLERITLALLAQHGLQPARWSPALRSQLGLSA
jgi:seryl-tRNA synthetase